MASNEIEKARAQAKAVLDGSDPLLSESAELRSKLSDLQVELILSDMHRGLDELEAQLSPEEIKKGAEEFDRLCENLQRRAASKNMFSSFISWLFKTK